MTITMRYKCKKCGDMFPMSNEKEDKKRRLCSKCRLVRVLLPNNQCVFYDPDDPSDPNKPIGVE